MCLRKFIQFDLKLKSNLRQGGNKMTDYSN